MKSTLALLIMLLLSFSLFAQAPKSRSLHLDGVKINYYDIGKSGSDRALVLVHCWTCNAEFWKYNYNAFPNYRVIAMDLPGHGTSDKPRVDYSMEYFARAVDAVMKKAGVEKAVLAGHSMGTPIIRRYYELYPDKTLGLVVVDGALLPFGPRVEVDKFFEPLFRDYKTGVPTFVDGMLPTVQPELKAFIRTSMLATPEHVGQGAMRRMLDDAYAKHDRIEVPVLAVMAQTDFWPKDLEQQYKTLAPKTDFHMWSGVSHFLQLEKPKEFNDTVKAFVAKYKLL